MRTNLFPFVLLLAVFSCQRPNGTANLAPTLHLPLDTSKLLETLAFGSCGLL